ncbi:MAG: hypothetical protein ACR2LR_07475 [Hassallia sp.]
MPKEDKFDLSQASTSDILGSDDFVSELKTRISHAQLGAAVAVNKELEFLSYLLDFRLSDKTSCPLDVGFSTRKKPRFFE